MSATGSNDNLKLTERPDEKNLKYELDASAKVVLQGVVLCMVALVVLLGFFHRETLSQNRRDVAPPWLTKATLGTGYATAGITIGTILWILLGPELPSGLDTALGLLSVFGLIATVSLLVTNLAFLAGSVSRERVMLAGALGAIVVAFCSILALQLI
jgi:hypothetical protein